MLERDVDGCQRGILGRRRYGWVVAALAVGLATPASVRAQEAPVADREAGDGLAAPSSGDAPWETADVAPRFPVPLQQRPLTLPRRMVRVDASVDVYSWEFFGRVTDVGFHLGAGYGVTDDFELGALLIPVQVLNFDGGREVMFGDMQVQGTYRLIRGPVEVGARVELSLPTSDDYGDRFVSMAFGVPVLVRLGSVARLDTGVQVAVNVHPGSEVALMGVNIYPDVAPMSYPLPMRSNTGIPLILTANLEEHFYVGLRTGMGILDLRDAADSLYAPLGFHVGGTVGPSDAAVADLTVRFEWPFFASRHGATTDIWQVTFGASVHIDTLGTKN
jgi:hypothetical protein